MARARASDKWRDSVFSPKTDKAYSGPLPGPPLCLPGATYRSFHSPVDSEAKGSDLEVAASQFYSFVTLEARAAVSGSPPCWLTCPRTEGTLKPQLSPCWGPSATGSQ